MFLSLTRQHSPARMESPRWLRMKFSMIFPLPYLLVAHNGIARVVESYFHDMTNEEYSAAGIRNCELVEYRFE